jgi:4'-phosphopantetheinyl transferase EntD
MQDLSGPHLSADFQALFAPGVVAAALRGPGDVTQLLPAEADCLGRAAPQRVAEYAAGRQCARLALAQLGITGVAVLAAPDRRPVWPASVVGSITHTRGLCAAVVAPRSSFRGLGIDTEIIGNVHADLWPRICVPAEISWLESLAQHHRAAAAALVFAAKEAFYKCQSPLTDEWLRFADLAVQVTDFDAAMELAAPAVFRIIPQRPLRLAGIVNPPYLGRFRLHAEFVSAGVAFSSDFPD